MAKTKKHPFRQLHGEGLDNHMMVMHGWDVGMVAQRGSQNEALGEFYIAEWHQNAHHEKDQHQAH